MQTCTVILLLVFIAVSYQGDSVNYDEKEMEWVTLPMSKPDSYFTLEELNSFGFDNQGHDKKCQLEEICCLGALSAGGRLRWSSYGCNISMTSYFQRYMPKKEFRMKYPDRVYTMADVASLIGSKSLFFAGDSIMNQVQSYMGCNLHRRASFSYFPYATHKEISSPNITIKSNHNIRVSKPDNLWYWEYDIEYENKSSRAYYLGIHKSWGDTHLNFVIQKADVLLFNIGVHIYLKIEYYKMADIVLKKFIPFASNREKLFIWRETSAQHTFTDGGEYDPNRWKFPGSYRGFNYTESEFNDKYRFTCQPNHFSSEDSYRWRDKIIEEVAHKLNYTVFKLTFHHIQDINTSALEEAMNAGKPIMYLLPFYQLTSGLWNMHGGKGAFYTSEGGMACSDPTHFCSTPYIWEHVYDKLYRAIKLAKYNKNNWWEI